MGHCFLRSDKWLRKDERLTCHPGCDSVQQSSSICLLLKDVGPRRRASFLSNEIVEQSFHKSAGIRETARKKNRQLRSTRKSRNLAQRCAFVHWKEGKLRPQFFLKVPLIIWGITDAHYLTWESSLINYTMKSRQGAQQSWVLTQTRWGFDHTLTSFSRML